MFVHIIRGDHNLRVATQDLAQLSQLGLGVGNAGGIGRAVDDKQASVVGDAGFQLLCRDLEVLFDACLDDHRSATGQDHHVRVGHPIRRRDDDLVTRIDHGLGQIEKTLLAAAGDQNLIWGVVKAVVSLELGDDGLLELRSTVHRGVFGETVIDRANGGAFDVIRGVEVRLTSAEANDILAGCA